MRRLKAMGFSDARLAKLTGQKEAAVRAARHALDIRPCYKRIDTCAAEFQALTPYMYSTYEVAGRRGQTVCESQSHATRRRSSSWAAGPTASARASSSTIAAAMPPSRCRSSGYETIMVNCNPETVSTDYDTSDRLYFEPLTAWKTCWRSSPRNRKRAPWPA